MKRQSFMKLKGFVQNFAGKKILIIGDLILDEFMWGNVSRISPEAPVPVVWVRNESFMPGGAANVAHNITSLGGKAFLVGIVGADERGAVLRSALTAQGIEAAGIETDPSRPTTLKTRVIAHQQQVVRIDKEMISPVGEAVIARQIAYVRQVLPDVDAIIIEDYGKGFITPRLLKPIIQEAKRLGKIIAVDPKEEHFPYYRGATVITPNHHEASRAVGIKLEDRKALYKAGELLQRKYNLKIVLITLGEEGMSVFDGGKVPQVIPTVAQEVYDVSGAGDTVISSYTLALAAGANAIQAAHIANCAAGIVVGKVGISVVEPRELIKRLRKETAKS